MNEVRCEMNTSDRFPPLGRSLTLVCSLACTSASAQTEQALALEKISFPEYAEMGQFVYTASLAFTQRTRSAILEGMRWRRLAAPSL